MRPNRDLRGAARAPSQGRRRPCAEISSSRGRAQQREGVTAWEHEHRPPPRRPQSGRRPEPRGSCRLRKRFRWRRPGRMAGPRRRSVHRHLSLPLPVTGLATGIPVPRLRQLPDASGRSARSTSRLPSQHPWRSAGLRGVRRPGSCRYRLSSSRWPSRPRRLRSPGIRGLRVGPGAQAVNHPAAAAVHRGDPRRLLRVPARQSQGDVHPLAGSDDDPRHHLCLGYHLLLRPAWRFLALLLLHQPTRHDRPGEAVVVLVRPLRPVRCQQHLDDVRLLDSHP